MLKRVFMLALLAGLFSTAPAAAQRWDTPLFFSPKPMDDVGLYWVRTDAGRFGNINGVKGIWRQSGNINLGVQAGIGDLEDIGNAIMVGAEFYNPLTSLSSSTGLVMAWSLGAGATFGSDPDYVDLSIPLGVSVGLNLGSGSGVSVLPYAHPRVSFDLAAFDNALGEEETINDIGFAVDLGADVNLGERFILRVGYTLGSDNDLGKRDGFGVGAALRIPRKLVVR